MRTSPLVARGAHFTPHTRVVVTELTGPGSRIARVPAFDRGTFRVAFRNVAQPCGTAFAVRARNAAGETATLRLPLRPCVPPPRLTRGVERAGSHPARSLVPGVARLLYFFGFTSTCMKPPGVWLFTRIVVPVFGTSTPTHGIW